MGAWDGGICVFSSEILKILFVVVKETSSSYVEELVAIMYLGWHSLAHLLSKSATYSDILKFIKSFNFIGSIRVEPSQICISTQMDLFAKQELRSVAIENTQARRQGGCTGCTCTPPGKNVPLRNVQKRRESSALICRQKRMCTFRSDTTKLSLTNCDSGIQLTHLG